MKKSFMTMLCLLVFFLDGWGYLIASLMLLAIHWDYLEGMAGDLFDARIVSDTVERLRRDVHAEADLELVLAAMERAR